jgi:hypothetical protein
MAMFFAVRDGLQDVRTNRPAYFWSLFTEPAHRHELLHESWRAVARVFTLAVLIDAVYQFIVLRWFYPGKALIVAFILALLPYLAIRGPVNRIAHLWVRRPVAPS